MQLNPGNILHVYNRGNNKQLIFFNEDNYYFFTDKVKKQIATVSDVLAYCLMPNHFHFLLHTTEYSCQPKKVGSLTTTELQNGIRLLQSSYANSINKQYTRTGSLFQQNTKLKVLNEQSKPVYRTFAVNKRYFNKGLYDNKRSSDRSIEPGAGARPGQGPGNP